ncbi:hypothetical protein J2125_001667 [Erwinia toletana]|uniref:Uncharacterized protein n=1 Tax=Winslowiella toletana TaxID=92490 RepID=A0ABS4P8Q5_9GAMM|nr:hypothetical protein [Winslowiella toletana]MBP2168475.1 hypothetical protein [Winslowiella toletana]
MEITSPGNNLTFVNLTSVRKVATWSGALRNVTNFQAMPSPQFSRGAYYSLTSQATACVEALNAKLEKHQQCETYIGLYAQQAGKLLVGADQEQNWQQLDILESLRTLFVHQCTADDIPGRIAGDPLTLISTTSQQMIDYTRQERAKCGDCYNQLLQNKNSKPIALDIANHTDLLPNDLNTFNGNLQHLHPISAGGEMAKDIKQQSTMYQLWYQHHGSSRPNEARLEKCVLEQDERLQELVALKKSAERPLAFLTQPIVNFYQWLTARK